MIKNTLKLLLVFSINSVANAQPDQASLLHQAGYFADATSIDGPDLLGNENAFRATYEQLKSRYGKSFLPDELPRELHSVRARIHDYIVRRADGRITGRGTHYSGENGVNNGSAFDYSLGGLADKLTRVSYCFGVSPRILTALVEKESEFIGSAISGTGAVGFMQVTNVAAVEVSEQLGFDNPHVAYSRAAADIYKEYIDCFLKGAKQWIPPWSDELKYTNGRYIVYPSCTESLNNCRRGSKRLRTFKSPYSQRIDEWLTGKFSGASHDNGLIYGAVLLKYHLGHSGIVRGLQNYNGDPGVKVSYSSTIRSRAQNVNQVNLEMSLAGRDYQIPYVEGRDDGLIDALDILSSAVNDWSSDDSANPELLQNELERMSVPQLNDESVEI